MKKNVIILLLSCFAIHCAASDGVYAVANIPAALLVKTNVVKRLEERNFEITTNNKTIYKRRVAYTILNEQGSRWAYLYAGYDKLSNVESIEGQLYDATGKKIKSLKKSDIKDESGSSGSNLADDDRVKWYNFFYTTYPYTVEYEVSISYKGTMFLPAWTPQEDNEMSVQQSQLKVSCDSNNSLHYKMYQYSEDPEIVNEKDIKTYIWHVQNLSAVEEEYAAPDWRRLTTSVYLATEYFSLEGYSGSNASWKDFGKFVYSLTKGRDVLPENIKQKVHSITNGLVSDREKVTKLYEYLQQNTRYISIQLGVGGWQPFDAKFVAEKKYGDCKALTNFMYSLLKEANIRSVYTLIRAGDENDYLIPELPSSQFNHVILFVPNNNDTIWLECTSQTIAAGYLGKFTSNRSALAIDESGGTLVRTPVYTMKDNLQIRHAKAKIDESGNLNVLTHTSYQAEQQDRIHQIINRLSKEEQIKFLRENIDLGTYEINRFNYEEIKSALPLAYERLDITANNYATITGKRLFIVPNIFSKSSQRLTINNKRKSDIVLDWAFSDIDSTEIIIPDDYIPESIPQNTVIKSPFGIYTTQFNIEKNKITYIRRYDHFGGSYPAKDYTELVNFYDAIYKADRARIVLLKQ